jgi:hypothetical protein
LAFGAPVAFAQRRVPSGFDVDKPDFAKSLTRLGLVDEYRLTTVPIAIGAGHSPFGELGENLKLDVVTEERLHGGALAQILVPKP